VPRFLQLALNTGKVIKKTKTEKDKNVHKDAQGLNWLVHLRFYCTPSSQSESSIQTDHGKYIYPSKGQNMTWIHRLNPNYAKCSWWACKNDLQFWL